MSMACSDLESSVIPTSQSPKVELTCCLWRTVPLQKVSFKLCGRVLKERGDDYLVTNILVIRTCEKV